MNIDTMPLCSPLHHIDFANIHCTSFAIDSNDHCQGDRRLCRCNSDNEDSEDLTGQVGRVRLDLIKERKTYHRDIDSIEHNLDAHQYGDSIALGNCTV